MGSDALDDFTTIAGREREVMDENLQRIIERLRKSGVGGLASGDDLNAVCDAASAAPCWRDHPTCAGIWLASGMTAVYLGEDDSLYQWKTPPFDSPRWFGPIPVEPKETPE